jgi:hypothetical protein
MRDILILPISELNSRVVPSIGDPSIVKGRRGIVEVKRVHEVKLRLEDYFRVWKDTKLREEPLGMIPHSRMSDHPNGPLLCSEDSIHICLAGAAGNCGAVSEMGVEEGVVES